MHIKAIRKFLEDHPQVKSQKMTTSQINRGIVKPESLGTNEPYIHKYATISDPNTGIPYVATATVFVSHAWRYPFYDIVADVMEQHAESHPDAYFWFDLFTNDQNEVASKDFEWFSSTFRDGVRDIGTVLLILSPWDDPMLIRRAWCLFEIFNSLAAPNVELLICLPRSEISKLGATILRDSEYLIKALSSIQAEKAEAREASDSEMIFEVIRKSSGGFPHVNTVVKHGLRSWYVKQLNFLLEKSPDDHLLSLSFAKVMAAFGFVNDALACATKCLDSPNVDEELQADVLNTIANFHFEKRNFSDALLCHNKSLAITIGRVGETHQDVAQSFNNIANANCMLGHLDTALQFYNKSLEIVQTLYGGKHNTVAAYNNIGNLYKKKGNTDEALQFYNKCLAIQLGVKGNNHPEMADVYDNIGKVFSSQGDPHQALEYHNKSLAINLPTLGEDHPSVGSTYNSIANIYSDL